MTKYEKLKAMKDNFTHAAATTKDNQMIDMWFRRADEVQKKIDELTVEESMREILEE